MQVKTRISTKNITAIIILIITIILGGIFYSKYNYNDYIKSVREKGKTSFSRDGDIKYSKTKSYKLVNKEYNDAMFYKTIQVKPNTPYRITCKVKTENVNSETGKYYAGAQIAIKDTTECSESVTGTSDWTELNFMFNSKNRETIDVGFRLGGYDEKVIGTAWFSDFTIEEGTLDTNNEWNVACFIIQNVDVTVNINNKPTQVKISMKSSDIENVKSNMRRMVDSIKNISGNQMTMTYDTFEIETPLKSLSYDEDNEYYIDPADVKDILKEYLDRKEYDYIFVATRLGDLNESKNILVHDWLGLGGMDYYGIGFSNIRLPDNANSYIYKYSSSNTFPEEVFIHEFLHTLERNEKAYGNNNLASLHDYEQYGYKRENVDGLRKWYTAYMQNLITNTDGSKAGLTTNIYASKPIHKSNFRYSYELNELNEPQNFIEEVNSIINRIKKLFKR